MTTFAKTTQALLGEIVKKCTVCQRCARDCLVLATYAPRPKDFFDAILHGEKVDPIAVFSCSQCRHCTLICPLALAIPEAFLVMRRELVEKNNGQPPLRQLGSVKVHQYLSCHPLFTVVQKGVKK